MATASCSRPAVLLVAVLALGACENNLIFMERSGFNLSIGVNDDPVTPVEVNAGLKRAVVALVPAKGGTTKTDKGTEIAGEAVTLVSGYDLAYTEAASSLFGGTLKIKTQFASGEAAKEISKSAAAVDKVAAVRLVRVVPADLQKRREAAADYVKSLQDGEVKALAADLGKTSEPDALLAVLNSISAAETAADFERIAQKIKIRFGKEV